MRMMTFLSEKGLYLVSQLFIFIFIAFLFSAFGISTFASVFVMVVMSITTVGVLLIEWYNKNKYYKVMTERLSVLKEKHLSGTLLDTPEYQEGQIWYEWFQEASKSMNDCIGELKREQLDYRDYIEAWVHEIKIPITVIRLICDNAPSESNRSLLDEVQKIEAYIEQALFYARSQSLEKDYVIKQMTLSDVVKDVVKKNAVPLIALKASVQMDNLDCVVSSDAKWVEFILSQMVSNSIKYGKTPLKLIFSTKEHPSSIELIIEDNGMGIPEFDVPRVFDKGFSGENGRKFAKSTGMGLYLCKKMCDKMYIGLTLSSTVGEGTSISMMFPKDRSKLFER